jgi:hypothetical protein
MCTTLLWDIELCQGFVCRELEEMPLEIPGFKRHSSLMALGLLRDISTCIVHEFCHEDTTIFQIFEDSHILRTCSEAALQIPSSWLCGFVASNYSG